MNSMDQNQAALDQFDLGGQFCYEYFVNQQSNLTMNNMDLNQAALDQFNQGPRCLLWILCKSNIKFDLQSYMDGSMLFAMGTL